MRIGVRERVLLVRGGGVEGGGVEGGGLGEEAWGRVRKSAKKNGFLFNKTQTQKQAGFGERLEERDGSGGRRKRRKT